MRSVTKNVILKLSQASPIAGLALAVRHRLPEPIKNVLRATRRQLQLTPMKRVLNELRKRGVSLRDLDVLEVFGAHGDNHVKDYASLVSSLEIWDIDPDCEKFLKKNFPKATVKITDSYQEVKQTPRKHDLIVVDNGLSIRGRGYCEHFDLFPDIFRVANDSCVLILNVISEADEEASKIYPYLFNDEQLARRRAFYRTNHPEKVTLAQMLDTYGDLARTNNFNLDWHFFQPKSFWYYLVLRISRMPTGV